MKVGDLVIHRHAPQGQGRVRLVIDFGKKRDEDSWTCAQPRHRATVVFECGRWDWKDEWRKIGWWDQPKWSDQ